MVRLLATLPIALSLACASGARPAPRAASPPSPAPAAERSAPPASGDARRLSPHASFGDLIAATQALQAAGAGASDAGCLLAQSGAGYLLQADVAPALRSLPDALPTLEDALATHAQRARVLTTWGLLGDPAGDGLIVAAVTRAAPTGASGAFVIALTATGAALRHSADASSGADALDDAAVPSVLAQRAARDVYVTAEAGVPLSRLHALLAAVPAGVRVALAVALPPETRLPAAQSAPATATQLRCPDGLPEPGADEAEGELDAAALRSAMAPLAERAAGCLELARGPAQAGGKLLLGLRIGRDGRPLHACLVQDGVGDDQLAACVVEHARALQLPRPSPAGFVDVHLPLTLTPGGPPPQRATCE